MPGKIGWRTRGKDRLSPPSIRTEIAGETCRKCRNTRAKCFVCSSVVAGGSRDWRLSGIVCLWRLGRRSFSLLEVSRKCSHLIHIDSLFALPAGWRLETCGEFDKKKTEFFFSSHKKKS